MKIEIDDSMIPEGYEPIEYGKPKYGDLYLDTLNGGVVVCKGANLGNRILLQKKRWKPRYEKSYLRITPDCQVTNEIWFNDSLDKALHSIGNCYPTREEAEQAAERVRKAYLGE